ncbi:transporter, hydrophobe/amphiphile efflux-1 (HAE1) family [Anaeromyxobacter dehalogenans 2CP-1]|uniref:Transporter, hydrophobe/amphiphile efflux-1 (HAE1) family n=1 Tax=Anaeromyxobacter dehalogenans (strain ATCC BAA-258 / DSM 21875 / 2CP-1) TaxID=455488 RepID=B8JBY1_ANAD2|nr:efflux RND transporter permease subunit [Anaeromyxobacter dehalogenans]ACL63903.1 transporter, hydrophobe/amphiphile efflux-1 (HAE1) family [Anaeromyxobacter dehalogenans 2CP-1]
MARFFIDRPIFAWVISIMIMLAGGLAILGLPVSQYPAIAPPVVTVYATYPGANAQTLENSVTQVIEQKMTGIDHLRYMSAASDSSGNASVTLTFEAEADPDIAQMQVQNKLQNAMPLLPQQVQQQGVRVLKTVSNYLLIAGLISEDGSMTRDDLNDYAFSNIVDPISRVTGVGEVTAFGTQYAMRIWLDADKLASFKLTPLDVSGALRAQNAQVSTGSLGAAPAVPGQQLNATVTSQTRLQTPEQFLNILLRVNPDGSQVRLRDVGTANLGGETYELESYYNGKPAGGMGIRLASGANALKTADLVRAKLTELSQYFPPGMKVVYPVDSTPFVRISIEEVVKTLAEAIILVFLVMFLFLQNFRATLIPTIAVPVVLLGTFGVLAAAGFTVNTLTMLGLVLAIGLLVDDAIVVVENVERVMSEEGLSPREATRKSMGQITGALVGIALVLAAVFVPMAFFGGSVGVIYRQFSITVVSAMALSVVVALTLTPALCATILKPVEKGHHASEKGFFGWFNRLYGQGSGIYEKSVGWILRRAGRALIVYAVLLAALGGLFLHLPTGFLPEEDQGSIINMVQLPAGATMDRTRTVMQEVTRHYLEDEKDNVEAVMAITGFSFSGRGQNAGLAFVRLKDWSERPKKEQHAPAIAGRAMRAFSQIKDGLAFAFVPPAVPELGNATGFELQLQDRGNLGHEALMAARNQLLGMAAQDPRLAKVRPLGLEDTPQYRIDVDQQKAAALGLSLSDINATLSSTWGVNYVDDFVDKGRTKRVYVQAAAPFRMKPEDLNRWYVRNAAGQMVPFSAFSTGTWVHGPTKLERFNGSPAMVIQGEPSPGHSSGEAMAAMEEHVKALPAGIGLEWSGLSYEERLSGANAPALYTISLLVVFLALAALYESWSIPFSVMLVVPLGVLGAVLFTELASMDAGVYFQVGLLTTIGLSAKNAILIVEFARALYEQGMSLFDAAVEAARMRLRPIIMTSLAFILGVLPLAIANGAGAAGQNAIGVAVIGGMVSATFLAILLVPVFFVKIAGKRKTPPPDLVAGPRDDEDEAAPKEIAHA